MEKPGMLLFFMGFILVTVAHTVLASDPDLTTDFGINTTSPADFTSILLRNPPTSAKGVAAPTPVPIKGLTGLGIAIVFFSFGAQSQIDPHHHPRATEVFYVLEGTLDVGFVDTTNTLFATTLKKGDIYVFPKGMVHFQRNNADSPAVGYSALTSENPGTILEAKALFTSGNGVGLPDIVLATALGTSVGTVEGIKHTLNNPPKTPSY